MANEEIPQMPRDEKAHAVADIERRITAIQSDGREPDLWERVYLLDAIRDLFHGAYGSARNLAARAATPPNDRNLTTTLPTDPNYTKANIASLRRYLAVAVAEPAPSEVEPAPSDTVAKVLPALVPRLPPGEYSDGHPLDEVNYLECKLILKPDRFTAAQAFLEYGAMIRNVAKKCGIVCDGVGVALRPQIREVLFLDTPDFQLYYNAFILRRRIRYELGFPAGEPEIVFKFRHPEAQAAASLDVRPNVPGKYRIKFKSEALPLKGEVGGYRLLFSHNVQFGLSQLPEGERTSMATLAKIFPCLTHLSKSRDYVQLVNQTIVEEVLQDLGTLDFGKGVTAKANIALWRERGMHRPLCGEFAFQAKFKRRDALHDKALERARAFFIALQQADRDGLDLSTTKTGMVYRLRGDPRQALE